MIAEHFRENMNLLQRGENSYSSGNVVKIIFNPESQPAVLQGTVDASMKKRSYSIEILVDPVDGIVAGKCSCPRGQVICHHMAILVDPVDGIVAGKCSCPRGQVICHHMAALCIYAHHNVSVTDKVCSWSASTSPARSPSPSDGHQPYGWHCGPMRSSRRGVYASAVVGLPVHHSAAHQSSVQHSHPMLGSRRGQGRRLPPTPCKPSTLQLRPGPINFPKLNASPTHVGLQSHSTHSAPHSLPHSFPREREPLREIPPLRDSNPNPAAPLSFEQAVALGRGGRMLPSPVPNGYKPKATISRHSDSDDDDWC
ncbi:SWIM zinc finger protein [Popillia japonica]|uniref:SWIM zinc finger protein n=1 Tax=Popillia japonica TaxID=7064 RepID=A0AAW1K4L8_POPJA